VGAVLGLFTGMVVTLKEFFDVAWHGDVDVFVFVVPLEGDTTVQFAFPIDVQGVMFLEGIEKVVGMFFANIFNAKIITANEKHRYGLRYELILVFISEKISQ
jgi:hypothetical protein